MAFIRQIWASYPTLRPERKMHASAEFKGSTKELTPKRPFPHTPSAPFPVLIFCPVSVRIVFLITKIDML